MVVNQMIVAMAAHAYEDGLIIYHAASSVGNPLHFFVAADEAYKYFLRNPCVGKNGKIVKVIKPSFIKTMRTFRRYMHRRYKVPLQVMFINFILFV
jgi:fatty acyl-CoA reductase